MDQKTPIEPPYLKAAMLFIVVSPIQYAMVAIINLAKDNPTMKLQWYKK
jgi:hypothetical protein